MASRAQAERVLTLGFAVIRSVSLVQAILATASRVLPAVEKNWLPLACLSVFILESVVIMTTVVRRIRTPFPPPLLLLDGTVGIGSLAIAVTCAPAAERLTPWSVGLHTAALSAGTLIGFSLRNLSPTLLLSSGLGVLHLVAVAVPAWPQRVTVAAAISNSLMYPGFAVASLVFARLVRNLADEADRTTARVAALEREAGRETIRQVLPFLSPEIPTVSDDRTRSGLADQRRSMYQRMRSFVDGVPARGEPPTAPPRPRRNPPSDGSDVVAPTPRTIR